MTDRARFEAWVSGLPGTSFVEQWGSLVAKVGGKVFALWNAFGEQGAVVIKVPETSFEILTAGDGIAQAAYFAKRHWIRVEPGAMSEGELEHYLLASHALVATGLTKKLQRELGLLAEK